MIAFVILHYQALGETIKCVKNIKDKCKNDSKIVIVDNYSPNKSGKDLEKEYKADQQVEVILTDSNLGFAKGNNIGYKIAKKYNPDFIIVMNNDVLLLQDDFEKRIIKSYDKHHFDVMGPDIFSTRTNLHQNPQRIENYTLEELIKKYKFLKIKNQNKWLIKLKYALLKHQTLTSVQMPGFNEVQIGKPLHGACYVFSKKFISLYNKCFYDKTFMYYESYILHYIGMREKMTLVYDPGIKVEHHEDVATDLTYKNLAQKAIWTNECLLKSCGVFIELMRKNENAGNLLN